MTRFEDQKNKPSEDFAGTSTALKNSNNQVYSSNITHKLTVDKIKDQRRRVWTFIAYPDSVPPNWEEVLTQNCGCGWVCSPLHDQDEKEDLSGEKKAHWHIVLIYSNNKSPETVNAISKTINATTCQPVRDMRSMIRYMTHIDYPSKHQYSKKDIRLFGGVDVDIDSYFLTKADLKAIQKEMWEWSVKNHIWEFCDLVEYAMNEKPDWFDWLVSSPFLLVKSIDSRRHKKENLDKTKTKQDEAEIEELARKALASQESKK